MSFTELVTGSFHLERQIQCFLVLDSPLLVRARQAVVDQAEIDACGLG